LTLFEASMLAPLDLTDAAVDLVPALFTSLPADALPALSFALFVALPAT
jgi:hypothetical protein